MSQSEYINELIEEYGAQTASQIAVAIAYVQRLNDEARVEVFANFCTECGKKDPKCQCWNDE